MTSPSWDSIEGTLQRFERRAAASPWQPAGAALPVVLGRTGLAWGRGVVAVPPTPPQKREGDGKSPAGVFTLGKAFGFAEAIDSKLPYAMLRDATECIDDAGSEHYNAIVDRDRVAPIDWNSSEKMRAIEQYRLGVAVNHNVPAVRGGGSCIFLHIWSGRAKPTAGCTAMSPEDLTAVVRWLDPSMLPLVVQVPIGDYEKMRERLALPDLLTRR